jgi:MYXO-CTERM domain-containing protein
VHPNTTTGGQRIADTVYAALKAAPDGGAADVPSGATDAPQETGTRDTGISDTGAGDAGGADAGKETAVSDTAVTDAPVSDAAVSDAATAEAGPSTDAPVDRIAADTGGTAVTPASDSGGCGCRTAGPDGNAVASWLLALLGLGLIGRRRRGC